MTIMNTPTMNITPNATVTNNEKNFSSDIRPAEESSFYEPPLRDASSQKFTQ